MDPKFPLRHKPLLRVEEAAQILNVSRWTVYRWVKSGRLGGTQLGARSLRIFSHTVAVLIDRHCVGSTPASDCLAGADSVSTGLIVMRM